MSERALRALVGAFVVVAALWGIATLLDRGGRGPAPTATGAVADILEDIDRAGTTVRMDGPLGMIELAPTGDAWTVNGHPADSGNVERFWQTVQYLEVGDMVASNPANHARMGVSADSAWSVTFVNGDDSREILIGDQGNRFATSYVRLPGEDAVYLLSGDLRQHVRRPLDQWRDKRVLALDTAQVERVEVERGGDRYTVVRADSAWTLSDGTSVDRLAAQNILTELANLQAAGFLAANDSIAGLAQDGAVVARSLEGTVLGRVTFGEGSGDRWLRADGNDVLFRAPGFRIDRVAPTGSTIRGEG